MAINGHRVVATVGTPNRDVIYFVTGKEGDPNGEIAHKNIADHVEALGRQHKGVGPGGKVTPSNENYRQLTRLLLEAGVEPVEAVGGSAINMFALMKGVTTWEGRLGLCQPNDRHGVAILDDLRRKFTLIEEPSCTFITPENTSLVYANNRLVVKGPCAEEVLPSAARVITDDVTTVLIFGQLAAKNAEQAKLVDDLFAIATKRNLEIIYALPTDENYLRNNRGAIAQNIARSHYSVCNYDEARAACGYGNVGQMKHWMETTLQQNASISGRRGILITDGSERAYAYCSKEKGWKDNYPEDGIKLSTTLGGGDNTAMGFVIYMLDGQNLVDSVRFAMLCGAAVVEKPGASLPNPPDDLRNRAGARVNNFQPLWT